MFPDRLLCLAVLFGAGLLQDNNQNTYRDVIESHGQTPTFKVHAKVEEKAGLLQDNNQDTFRALADEIFQANRGFGILSLTTGISVSKIPASLDAVIKDRLVYAEMQYRQGRGRPVTEDQIIKLTNMLADEFGLPAYAHTNQSQVRSMRMFLMHYNPTLMGIIPLGDEGGKSISDDLSPLQATHLLLEVIGHKLSDHTFQLAPGEEWDQHQAKLKAERESVRKSGSTKVTYTVVAVNNTRAAEVNAAIGNHVKTMSPVEALSLLETGFDTLGIAK